MKVLTRSFAFIFLLICLRTSQAHDSSEEDDSSEEQYSSEVKEGSSKLEEFCHDGYRTIKLGKLEDSSVYFTIGEDHEEMDKCRLEIYAPHGYGIVMVVEQYSTENQRSLDHKNDDCNSKLQISYHNDEEEEEAAMCLLGDGKSDRSLAADVEYVLFSSKSNEMFAEVKNDGEYSYGLVLTSVNLGDCHDDEEQCDVGASKVIPHCIWSNLTCDGHVNCAITPQPPDEYSCPSGNTFNGKLADEYYYYWSNSVLLFAMIIIPIIGLLLVAIVLILVCMRKVYRRRQLRNMAQQHAHVNVIAVPDWEKDDKSSKPPDYQTIEELPPAYHTLFLPSTMTRANDAYNQPPPSVFGATTENSQTNEQQSHV